MAPYAEEYLMQNKDQGHSFYSSEYVQQLPACRVVVVVIVVVVVAQAIRVSTSVVPLIRSYIETVLRLPLLVRFFRDVLLRSPIGIVIIDSVDN